MLQQEAQRMTQSYFKPARLTLKIGFSGDVEGTFDGRNRNEMYFSSP